MLVVQMWFVKREHSTVKEYLYPNLHINALISVVHYFLLYQFGAREILFSPSLIEQCHNIKF